MQFQYIPYLWPLAVSSLITLFLAVYAAGRSRAKGAVSFMLSMFLATLWSFANALEMAGVDLPTKLFWANIQYFAYAFLPVAWLALVMEFTGYDHWLRKKIYWFAVVPVLVVILVWTDGRYGLVRYGFSLDYNGPFPVINKKYGPVFFLHCAHGYILNLCSLVLLFKAVFIKHTIYRKQAAVLLFSLGFVMLTNLLYTTGLGPIRRFDLTPAVFGLAGTIVAWGIFRFRLFDLVPAARHYVIENMSTGVMVLDHQNRVVDLNPAFSRITGAVASRALAKTAAEVCAGIPPLVNACRDKGFTGGGEFSIKTVDAEKFYEFFVSPLTDRKGVFAGRVVVVHDITERKHIQQELLKQQCELAAMKERERLARDLHDNLGQVLGFINLQAQGIERELAGAGIETAQRRLERLIDVTQAAHREMREYIRRVRSTTVSAENLVCALKKEVAQFTKETGIKVNLEITPGFSGEEPSAGVRGHLLSIVKEALNNIRKHAGAQNVTILLLTEKDGVKITVEDDGKGFMLSGAGADKEFGLKIMEERAREIGGNLQIASVPGRGTRITVTAPFSKEKGER